MNLLSQDNSLSFPTFTFLVFFYHIENCLERFKLTFIQQFVMTKEKCDPRLWIKLLNCGKDMLELWSNRWSECLTDHPLGTTGLGNHFNKRLDWTLGIMCCPLRYKFAYCLRHWVSFSASPWAYIFSSLYQ